jgi:hypothetical protein
MEAAKIAAETLAEAFQEGNLTAGRLKVYQQRWRKAFGWDFWLYASLSLSLRVCVCVCVCVCACASCRAAHKPHQRADSSLVSV